MFETILLAGVAGALVGLRVLFGRMVELRAEVGRLERRLDAMDRPAPDVSAEVAAIAERIGRASVPKTVRTEEVAPPPARAAVVRGAVTIRQSAGPGEAPPPPPPPPPSQPERPSATPVFTRSPAELFEHYVGGKLPIWVGGAALAIAGYYMVRLAIEAGLLTPPIRVLLAVLAGAALVIGGEAARRVPRLAEDARVAQSLVGAGLATLYAAGWLAGSHYGLMSPLGAFLLLAAITVAALGLALRHGAPAAIMGLVGGFATPWLAGGSSDDVAPVLLYLGLLTAGLIALAIRRGWVWLALAGAGGSLVWTTLLILFEGDTQGRAIGLFILVLALASGFAIPRAGTVKRAQWLHAIPVAVGLIQLAALIPQAGYGLDLWGLYLLLAGGTIVLAVRDARLAPLVAGALFLSLAALGATLETERLATGLLATIGVTLLFGGSGIALALMGRMPVGWWGAIGVAGAALPWFLALGQRRIILPAWAWTPMGIMLAIAPLALFWARRAAPAGDTARLAAAAGASFLIAIALADAAPSALVASAFLLPAVGVTEAARRLGDRRLGMLAALIAAFGAFAVALDGMGFAEALASSLIGANLPFADLPPLGRGLVMMLVPAALFAVIAWRGDGLLARPALVAAGVTSAAALYLLAKQPFAIDSYERFVAYGFIERMLITDALLAGAIVARRWRMDVATALLAVAVARVIWLDLMVVNPAWVTQTVPGLPIINPPTFHFAFAAGVVAWWREQATGRARDAWLMPLLILLAGGAALITRHLFHAPVMAEGVMGEGEFYAYSATGLLLAVALLARGVLASDSRLRTAGLALLVAVVFKVFLVDAAALGGLLRVLSFLGLGFALIGIGWAYGRFLKRPAAPIAPDVSPEA